MTFSTLKVLAFMTAASLMLGACAFAGNNSTAVACVGNCPDISVGGSMPAKQYGAVADTGHVGDSASPVRVLGKLETSSEKALPKSEKQWYPWWSRKTNISRAALADAFEKNNRSILRVPVETFIREIGNLGLTVPQGQKEFAEWVRSSAKVKEVPCTKELLAQYNLSYASKDGEHVGMRGNRKSCYEGEKFLAFVHDDKTEQPFLSLGCGNLLTPKEAKKSEKDSNAASVLVSAETATSRGCPREEKSLLVDLAREKIGEEMAIITHCILKPEGPAQGVVWRHSNRQHVGIAYRWKRLVREGVPVNVPTVTGYRFSDMAVKAGQKVRFVTFPAGDIFEVEVLENGLVEVPKNLVSSHVGRTVLFFPRRIVTEQSIMKWRTEGVVTCYPPDGTDNQTRGPLGDKPSELFRAVGGVEKNFAITFTVICDGST